MAGFTGKLRIQCKVLTCCVYTRGHACGQNVGAESMHIPVVLAPPVVVAAHPASPARPRAAAQARTISAEANGIH